MGNKTMAKMLEGVAKGMDALQVFEAATCMSPSTCDQPGVVLTAIHFDNTIALSIYCIDHAIPLTEPMLKIMQGDRKELEKDGNVQ